MNIRQHRIDIEVYGKTRDDIERHAINQASSYFGHDRYDMTIDAECVETMGGQLLHWRARVSATAQA